MTLDKRQSRARWRELRDLINAWDPIGLIAAGAPADEYDCVVGPTIGLLEQRTSPERIATFLLRNFEDHFGARVQQSDAADFAARAFRWYSARSSESTG
jgi:hypothetical protein